MRFSLFAILFSSILAAPHAREPETKRYIVTLKQSSDQSRAAFKSPYASAIVREFSIIPSFEVEATQETYKALSADPNVASIEEDQLFHALGTVDQTGAPWNLVRLSAASTSSGNGIYRYNEIAGEGVDVYVVDTGVLTTHIQFSGRATLGYGATDGNGHGTAVAGVIAATILGVAKKASIVSVKVLSDSGSGSTADVMAGLSWIVDAVTASGRPSVVNMSIGGSASTAIDNAVVTLINAGIPVVVSSGDSNSNAANYSPARVPQAITVGGIGQGSDNKTSSSNYGSVVDFYAPAASIQVPYIGSNTATATLSGTSFAAAHVSGLAAYFFSVYGNINGLAQYAQNAGGLDAPFLIAHNDQSV